MKSKTKFQGKGLIKFLNVFFKLAFFLGAFSTGLSVIVKFFDLIRNTGATPVLLPVFFSPANNSSLLNLGGDGQTNLKIMWALGAVSAKALPTGYDFTFFLATVLASCCFLISIRLIISILDTVESGNFLIVKNAIRLRWIALFGITTIFVQKIKMVISNIYLSDQMDLIDLKTTSNFFSFSILSEAVFGYLFLLVLAEVFRVGAMLKEESELTI